ncbi:hypothetical protein FOA52_001077 [Chlamydomonas sp. UWO 241]|nr:hypothetical protein FOA52_001077 [Chlamydomonas sp. UWO 241]
MESLPTDVFLDILARAGGWTITVPGEVVVVVVTALSVCKQWRQELLDSPAHAVQLLMRGPPVMKDPCACQACDPMARGPWWWWVYRAQHFKELQREPLEYALVLVLVLAASIGADAAVEAMLATMALALQQKPATADDPVMRARIGWALVAAAARCHTQSAPASGA